MSIVRHGDGYAVSAKAAADLIVNSCVAASPACVPDAGYFPLVAVCAYDLGVTRNNNERRLSLRSVQLSDKVEQALA
jgi:succinate dehydrogenase/fumarate reductase flavoprotein subunit